MAFNQSFNSSRRRVPQLLNRFGQPTNDVPFFRRVANNQGFNPAALPGNQSLERDEIFGRLADLRGGGQPGGLLNFGQTNPQFNFLDEVNETRAAQEATFTEEGFAGPPIAPEPAPGPGARSPFVGRLPVGPVSFAPNLMPPGPDPFDVPQQSTFDSIIRRLLRALPFGDQPDRQRRMGFRVGDDVRSAVRQLIPEEAMGNASLAQLLGIGKELSAMRLKHTGIPTAGKLGHLANVIGDVVLNRQPAQQTTPIFDEFGAVIGQKPWRRPGDQSQRYSPERAYVPALKELQRYNFTPPQLREVFESLGIPFEKVANLLR